MCLCRVVEWQRPLWVEIPQLVTVWTLLAPAVQGRGWGMVLTHLRAGARRLSALMHAWCLWIYQLYYAENKRLQEQEMTIGRQAKNIQVVHVINTWVLP